MQYRHWTFILSSEHTSYTISSGLACLSNALNHTLGYDLISRVKQKKQYYIQGPQLYSLKKDVRQDNKGSTGIISDQVTGNSLLSQKGEPQKYKSEVFHYRVFPVRGCICRHS